MLTRDDIRQMMNRAAEKVMDGLENLSDAQLVYLLGVVDGMEGSAAAIAATTAAATQNSAPVIEFPQREQGGSNG